MHLSSFDTSYRIPWIQYFMFICKYFCLSQVRKVDSRSPRGRGTTQNNSFRPIIPKYATPGGNGATPRTPEMPLIPAGYMPSSERFSNFSGRPQQPYLPLYHPLISQPHYHLPMGAFPEVSHLLQQRNRYG